MHNNSMLFSHTEVSVTGTITYFYRTEIDFLRSHNVFLTIIRCWFWPTVHHLSIKVSIYLLYLSICLTASSSSPWWPCMWVSEIVCVGISVPFSRCHFHFLFHFPSTSVRCLELPANAACCCGWRWLLLTLIFAICFRFILYFFQVTDICVCNVQCPPF